MVILGLLVVNEEKKLLLVPDGTVRIRAEDLERACMLALLVLVLVLVHSSLGSTSVTADVDRTRLLVRRIPLHFGQQAVAVEANCHMLHTVVLADLRCAVAKLSQAMLRHLVG